MYIYIFYTVEVEGIIDLKNLIIIIIIIIKEFLYFAKRKLSLFLPKMKKRLRNGTIFPGHSDFPSRQPTHFTHLRRQPKRRREPRRRRRPLLCSWSTPTLAGHTFLEMKAISTKKLGLHPINLNSFL